MQEMEISPREVLDAFSKLTFHIDELPVHVPFANEVKNLTQYGLQSHKRPPKLGIFCSRLQKEEKPAGQVKQNPSLAQGLDPSLGMMGMTPICQ